MSKLFDIVDGRVVIHSDALGIPCFRTVWEADADPDKVWATKVISYIVLNNKYNSPYVTSMDEDTREAKLKKQFFGDSNYKLNAEETICEEGYKEFINTKTLQLFNNMRLKLDSISQYYKDSLDEVLDEKKIKDLLNGMAQVDKVVKVIDTLENMVKSEEAMMGRVKGDAKVNPYELV